MSTNPSFVDIAKNFGCAASAAGIAELITLPLDTMKVRMQLASSSGKIPSFTATATSIIQQDGVAAFWGGAIPGLLRQFVFASIRIGAYEPVRDSLARAMNVDLQQQAPPLTLKIAAAMLTGCIGIAVASPTDLVKVRLQAERRGTGVTPRYNGTIDAFRKILAQEGVTGFWKGVGPNMIRNATINACELATYDQLKQVILQNNILPNNLLCHMVSAAGAGFTAAVIGSPVDVLKTRLMNQSSGNKQYNGVIDAVGKIVKNEGFGAFYKGFSANAARIISWNMCMFLALEQIKAIVFHDKNN